MRNNLCNNIVTRLLSITGRRALLRRARLPTAMAGDQDTGAEQGACLDRRFCVQGSLVSGAMTRTRNMTKPLNTAPEVSLHRVVRRACIV